VPIFLVFLQPDFGSALVYCAALAPCCSSPGRRGRTSARWRRGASRSRCSARRAAAAGVPVLKQYQQHA
jgi:hypothetical protein